MNSRRQLKKQQPAGKAERKRCFLASSSRKQWCQQPLQLHHLQKWALRRQSRCSKAVSFVNIDEKCKLKMWPHSLSYLRVTAIRNIECNLSWDCKDLFSSPNITAENIFSKSKITLTVACHHTVAKWARRILRLPDKHGWFIFAERAVDSSATGEIKGWPGLRSGSKKSFFLKEWIIGKKRAEEDFYYVIFKISGN